MGQTDKEKQTAAAERVKAEEEASTAPLPDKVFLGDFALYADRGMNDANKCTGLTFRP